MAKSMFIWLGSGRARRQGVNQKGQLIDRAARAGLPVPPGAILLDPFYRLVLAEKIGRVEHGRVVIADPELLHNTLIHSVRLPRFERPVTFSPLFDVDDQLELQKSIAAGDLSFAAETAKGLAKVWTTYLEVELSVRCDVLLMEKPDQIRAGIALSPAGQDFDKVILHTQPVDELDQQGTQPRDLPRLRRFHLPAQDRPPYERRLQMLLRGIRHTFGTGNWRIEWVDDDQICWLLMVTANT